MEDKYLKKEIIIWTDKKFKNFIMKKSNMSIDNVSIPRSNIDLQTVNNVIDDILFTV